MKTRNFPKRKLLRKLIADGADIYSPETKELLDGARSIRTKKKRGSK